MNIYIFYGKTGECRSSEADPSLPETWPFRVEEIKSVFLDCTENFLQPLLKPLHQEKIEKLMAYIAEHYKEKITLNVVMQFIGMGKSNFNEFFKRQIGMTFIIYRLNLFLRYY